ncbi:MAG: hypothetical protein KC964_19100, partial [Candidatus Omnitrophica bacterium]|nr:hypothetical protein [Candidatus Omnitrophota bacterium]
GMVHELIFPRSLWFCPPPKATTNWTTIFLKLNILASSYEILSALEYRITPPDYCFLAKSIS